MSKLKTFVSDMKSAKSKTQPFRTEWKTVEKTVLAEFRDATTIHGIRYFADQQQHWFVRLIWLALSLAGIFACGWTLYPAAKSYADGDVRTTMLVKNQDEVPFPALTFCNVNTYRRSVIAGNRNNALLAMLQRGWEEKDIESLCPKLTEPVSDTLKNFDPFKMADITNAFLYMHDALQNFGMCFTFNPGKQFRSSSEQLGKFIPDSMVWYPVITGHPSKVVAAGYNAAVDIVLNSQHYDYCDAGSPEDLSAGFLMAVHDPAVEPWFALQPYVGIEPGCRTEVVVRLRRYERNTEKLKRCVSNVALNYYKDTDYNQQSCFVECVVNITELNCNCTPQQAPVGAFQFHLKEMQRSGISDVRDVGCLSKAKVTCPLDVHRKIFDGSSLLNFCPQCKIACQETVFVTEQISTQSFPSDNTAPLYFNHKYPQFGPNTPWAFLENDPKFQELVNRYNTHFRGNDTFETAKEVRANLLAVRVYFSSMAVETIEEDPLTNIEDLVSQLGGVTGLFLGASLLSFVELVYWASVAIVEFVKRKRIARRNRLLMRFLLNQNHPPDLRKPF